MISYIIENRGNYMKKILSWIQFHNNHKFVITLTILSTFCYLLMGTQIFGVIGEFDNQYMLDMTLIYSGNTFIETFRNISELQIKYYQTIHHIDYLFILTFYPLLVLLISRVYKKKETYVVFLPVIAMFSDFFENLIIDIHIHYGVSIIFASLSGIFTFLKFLVITISILIIIYVFIKRKRTKHDVEV